MAILGCFIRRGITACGSSKQVSRQLNKLFNESLPYSAALLHSACLARGWIYVRLDDPGLEKQEILVGATLFSSQCKLPHPELCALFLLAFSLAAALPAQAALPPPACSRLDWEILLTRGDEGGDLCHQHPRSSQGWCTHKAALGWAQQMQPMFGTKRIKTRPT